MIPESNLLADELIEGEYPSETYKIELSDDSQHRINGHTNDLEAIKQVVYLILNTERYEHVIYSWDYGVELLDLIGKPIPYVLSEIPRRIKDALMQDERIENVKDFEFDVNKNTVKVSFVVVSDLGDFSDKLEVNI